jgi:hypothetical protein
VVDIAKKAWQEGLRRYGHVIREKVETFWNEEIRRCGVVDIAGEGSKAEMVWTCTQ